MVGGDRRGARARGGRAASNAAAASAAADDDDTRTQPTPKRPLSQGPCCHDALSAKLIEQAGFDFAFMSGFCTSAARLGAPDTGLMSYAEMVDQVGVLCEFLCVCACECD